MSGCWSYKSRECYDYKQQHKGILGVIELSVLIVIMVTWIKHVLNLTELYAPEKKTEFLCM